MKTEDMPTDKGVDEYDWAEAFAIAKADPERVASVLRSWGESPEGYGSVDIAATFTLVDGRFGALTGWCDTTGWDCQAGADWYEADTEEELIRTRLTRREREVLGYPHPEVGSD